MKFLKTSKYGYFLIWAHGLSYRDKILKQIRNAKFIDILWLQRYNPKTMKRFIKVVYAYCDVPSYHLSAKTDYLLNIPSETFFIFFRNNDPDERYFGTGPFRLLQCARIKKLKEKLRNQYNPRKNGKRTEYHIIHASDNEVQVNFILRHLGYKNGIDFLKNKPNDNLLLPLFLPKFDAFKIKRINSSQLFCNILKGNINSFRTETIKIEKTPHYAFLFGDKTVYKNYINKFLGGPLRCDYNINNFSKLSRTMCYLRYPYSTSYIITKEIEPNKYLILDGLHRASILLFNKINSFPVVIK